MFKTKNKHGTAKEKIIYNNDELLDIGEKIYTILKKELKDKDVDFETPFGEPNVLYVYVGREFGAISDAVTNDIENAYNFHDDFREEIDNMSEEEFEKYFEEEYADQLKEINEENVIHVNETINTPKYTVNIRPLECTGDDCMAGLQAEIRFKHRINDEDIRNIAHQIANVVRNH
ncbi:MAG: hypothetical protein JHC26_09620 [Thermofilum sp.]|uniref:hypothetical protein n=1 Tax=Thermofilum sp. TaxID=1961369 RepID=UPI0025890060|nr:hypothetical protein [Thermofilum sp.]MCI4409339.1 hypothetical protein [Thermofilum sp.]